MLRFVLRVSAALGVAGLAARGISACTVEDRVATGVEAPADAAAADVGAEAAEAAPLVCGARTADCNGRADDGCETDLTTSRSHCAACGRDCGGADCRDGRCGAAVFTPTGTVISMVTDDRFIYWTETSPTSVRAEIRRAPKLGGSPSVSFLRLSEGGVPPVFTFTAVDAASLFWGEYTGPNAGQLHMMPKANDDGLARTSVTTLDAPFGGGVDATHVYWSDISGQIHRADKTLGTLEVVAKGGGSAGPLVVDETAVFWLATGVAAADGRLMRAPKSGHATAALAPVGDVLAADLPRPIHLTATATHVYWTNAANGVPGRNTLGSVMALSRATGAVETIAAGLSNPFDVAVDETHVYWSEFEGGALVRRALSGGPAEKIFEQLWPTGNCGGAPCDAGTGPSIALLRSDGDWLFWSDLALGGLWRWRKDLR